MRLLLLLIIFFTCIHGLAQQPFNYGKSKKIYFLSRKEIAKAGIETIYITSIPKDLKELPENTSISIIDFTNDKRFTNGWFPYYGKRKIRPKLNMLLDSSDFMNGNFYELGDDGRIAMSGMEGHGALCQETYEHDSLFTYASMTCKFGETSTTRKIFYYSNGLPKYSVCCSTDSFNYSIEEDSAVIQKDTSEDFKDTTWNIYNSKWQVTGTRTKEGIKPIFTFGYAKYEPQETYYINKTQFETFIDKKIGYRPALLLFEIYRNAVIAFKYDAKAKKYYEGGEISLE
jgi:hypothetical protein